MGHISIEVVSYNEGRLIVRAEQKDLVNDKFLSKKELTERIREMFKGEIPDNWKLTVSAVNFDRKDIDGITVDWIKRRMERLGLQVLTNAPYPHFCPVTKSLPNGTR